MEAIGVAARDAVAKAEILIDPEVPSVQGHELADLEGEWQALPSPK